MLREDIHYIQVRLDSNNKCVGHLRCASSRTPRVVLYGYLKMPINLNFKSQFRDRTEKISYAENNESFIYMLFQSYVSLYICACVCVPLIVHLCLCQDHTRCSAALGT